MKAYPLQQLAEAMKGTLVRGGGDRVMSTGVSTDTRKMATGALFFALKGDLFDAHDFLDDAVAAGAGALVVAHEEKLPAEVPPVVRVADPLKALQDLAKWYRTQLAIPVVAITGSNGKTSTKDFLRSVLREKFRVNATRGNFNNHIGLPLTVLETQADDEVGVFEMGMNHAGELAPLCEIARPNLSIITNIGTAHIEHLGSREAIAEEKGTVARFLDDRGTLLVPSDCDFLESFRASTPARVMTVGEGAVRAEKVRHSGEGSLFELVIDGLGRSEASIPVVGRHMVTNALLAAGAGVILGLTLAEVARGLARSELTSGRLRRFESGGVSVIDDTYNANPESVMAALQTLAGLPTEGRRIAVIGSMAELGDHADEGYRRVGKRAAGLPITLITVGPEAARYDAGKHFETAGEAAEWLSQQTTAGDLVLFKGSRVAAMERVMNQAFPD